MGSMADSEKRFAVRRATAADAEKMLALWQDAVQMLAKADSRFRLPEGATAHWQAALQEWLCRSDVAIFVAESTTKEDHLFGYIVGSIMNGLPTLVPERCGYVGDLTVDSHGKDAQGMVGGIGRGLFNALKDWFRDQGVTQVEARVPHRQPVGQAFWRAIGATELYEHMWLKLE
jgi:hypothetical protein